MYIYHTIYILWNLQVSHKRIKIGNFSLKKKKKKQNYTCNCTFSISATDTLRTINKRYSVCARNVCSQRSLDQLRARGLIELYCPTNCTRLPAIANRLKDIRRASLARQLSIRFYIPWFLNKKKRKSTPPERTVDPPFCSFPTFFQEEEEESRSPERSFITRTRYPSLFCWRKSASLTLDRAKRPRRMAVLCTFLRRREH